MRHRGGWLAAALLIGTLLASGCNPFAPRLDEHATAGSFGDPHTIPGYLEAFKYAYEFRDTSLYGALLAPDFTFSYRNYDRGVDVEWGRDDEMRSTAGLFAGTDGLSLLWGTVFDSSGTATVYDLTISFSLDVTFNAADVEHVDGRAIFHLERATLGDPWRATRWQDASTL